MANKGVNKAIIVGTLGQDPEVRYTPTGKIIVNLSVATSETWKDRQSGEQKESTEWHRVVIFEKLAEIAAEYLRKGSKVYLEGKLKTRKWQDQQGQDRYSTEIVIDGFNGEMQMLGGKKENSQAQEQRNGMNQPAPQGAGVGQAQTPQDQGFNDNFDDSIPF